MLPSEVFILEVLTDVGENDVLYTSSNEAVAVVKQTGEVTAVATGTANIKVSSAGKTATCKVNVLKDDRVAIMKITNVEQEEGQYVLPLGRGETYPIDTQIKFAGATVEGQLTFETSDADIVTVDANGVVTTGNQVGEATIYISGSYNGRFEDILVAEILVKVSNVNWSYEIEEGTLYPVNYFKGQSLKNQAEFDVSLFIGESEIELSQMTVTVADLDSISVEGNVITAKKAGLTYFDLSYYDEQTQTTYTRRQNINISRIIDDRLDMEPYTLTRLEDVSLSVFDKIAADYVEGSLTDGETQKVIDITEGRRNQITALGGSYQGLIAGEKQVEIYNDAFIVKVNLHIVDYSINDAIELKKVFYSATSEYIEIANDIYGVGLYVHPKPTLIFSGTIDGKGHVIEGVHFTNGAGFFGLCAGTFKNVAIVNAELDKMSAVLSNQSVGSGLKTDNVYVHVSKAESVETEGKETGCGALLLQIESGIPSFKNTIVEMYGVNGKNVGAIACAWYQSTVEIENCYFITDGTPYGYKLGYDGETGWVSIDGSFGITANQSNLDYVFVNGDEFNAERIKTDSTVNLSAFDSNIWDLNNNSVPRFKRDVRVADALRNMAVETTIATIEGESTVILASQVTEDYQIKLPEINQNVTALYACGLAIEKFNFNKTNKVLTFDYKDVSRFAESNVELLIVTEDETVYKTTFMLAPSECIVRTVEDLERVLTRNNGEHYVCYILNDIDGAVIENLAPYDDDWTNRATIYGLGHKLTNLTVKGEGILGQLGSGLVKDLSIQVKEFEPAYYAAIARPTASGVLGGDLTNLTLENVYFEASYSVIADTCLSNVKIIDCIFNIPGARSGKVIDKEHSQHPYEDTTDGLLIINRNYNEAKFFSDYANGLPTEFNNSLFELRDGTLFFNGKWVLGANKPVDPTPPEQPEQPEGLGQLIVGSLYNGEVAYLEKTSAEATQSFVLPTVANVSKVSLAGIELSYNSSTQVVTVNTADLEDIESGIQTLTVLANGTSYHAKLTVADYVINNDNEAGKIAYTDGDNYIVLATNIDASGLENFNSVTPTEVFTGTIDGKGNSISNLSISTSVGWWGILGRTTPDPVTEASVAKVFAGTIKNIAFINVYNPGSRGLFSCVVDGGTIENVYIEGRSNREQLFATIGDNGLTVSNLILDFEDGWDSKGCICTYKTDNNDPVSTGTITGEENTAYYNIWGNATWLADNVGFTLGDFEVKADGLYFNGNLIKAK